MDLTNIIHDLAKLSKLSIGYLYVPGFTMHVVERYIVL